MRVASELGARPRQMKAGRREPPEKARARHPPGQACSVEPGQKGAVGVQARGCESPFPTSSGSSACRPRPVGLCAHSGPDADPASWEPTGPSPGM